MNQGKPLLKAESVSRYYGDFKALQNVDISLYKGDFLSVVGPNGAGKSTLINVLTGMHKPTRGQVFFLENDIVKVPPFSLSTQGLARAFQLTSVFMDLTIRQTLSVAATTYLNIQWNCFSNLLKQPRVSEIVSRVSNAFGLYTLLDVPAQSLSHGQRKLLDVASAYALHPKVMLLDEPTAGVSTADKHAVMETLLEASDKLGIEAIMLVEHDMDLVSRYSTRIVAMQGGIKIADANRDDFFRDEEVLSIVIGKGSSNVTYTR